MPIHKYRAFPPDRAARPHAGRRRVITQRAALVQRRSARRQPGADRADGRRAQARACSTRWCAMGFKEIEVGFPAASQTDFDFVRELIEERPDPRRRHHPGADPGARPTSSSAPSRRSRARSAPSSTSTTRRRPLQRRVVFGLDRAGIVDIAVDAARSSCGSWPHERPRPSVRFEYSPESFTGTELDFARRGLRGGDATSGSRRPSAR